MLVALLFGTQVASAEGWPGCPWGSAYDPMSNGYVPACFTRPADAESVAPKPAGLAQAAPVARPTQAGQDCPWGYPLHDAATHTFVSQCANTNSAAAVSKPVGLAQPAPAEKFIPCGFGERLDPLALTCQP